MSTALEDKIVEAAAGLYWISVPALLCHVILHVNKPQADTWEMDEIIKRWFILYKGNVLSQRYIKGESLDKAERAILSCAE